MTTVEVVDIKIPQRDKRSRYSVCRGACVLYVVPNMTGVTYTWNVTGGTLFRWTDHQLQLSGDRVEELLVCIDTHGKSGLCFIFYCCVHCQNLACFHASCNHCGVLHCMSEGNNNVFDSLCHSSAMEPIRSVVPATAGNIMTANGTNQISIKWVDNSNPNILWNWKSVGVTKIQWCYQ